MSKLPSCCAFRKLKAGQCWGEYTSYVRRLSTKLGRGVKPNEEQIVEMKRLKDMAARQREAYRDHMADESLEHK
jgi:hypothetical protein